ncbi:phage antirepressor KilAC domain-containing protein [Acinetobacter sp. AG3]|uniref:phage antirepressor KilAC domain-containing protein n=1 Tax=Acinetobacter TaxID=469 RepID=UPI001EF00237|nr:phage antirepressor KilAC domain-containing protein [Acinetobacter sp. AG3]MDN5434106.1 phage antirepressor KilAC domain-containing protein [Acinetobacter sp.]MCG7221963.1 phage antirepressor KilAC domain-containing protein [Acinetobacter sp. AG3]MDN5490367.1 phage antirepressor KilAC domain-containing protein [Acinetobacter sp.]MDN5625776.1 phage antirepressor KilAC domain-containing protein [Acinetobacter sp.]MDN5650567.1 phage antirepressor KilAC domain-containing protein [Acinetobacter 
MNAIVPLQTQSMNSLEIAELVQSEHRAVTLSIERLAKKGVIQLPPMVKVENKQSLSPNKFTNVYEFTGEQGKRDSIIVVAQLCPEFTARLVDRWQELETQVAKPVFDISNPHHLLQAIETQAKQNIELTQKVEILEPKANALDAIANAEGTVTLDQAAKLLGVQPKKFLNPWLENNKWCFRRSGELNPYQDKIDKKYLIAVYRTFQGRSGEQHNTVQTRVTSLGMTQLTIELKKWQESQLKEKAA